MADAVVANSDAVNVAADEIVADAPTDVVAVPVRNRVRGPVGPMRH